MKWLKDVVRQYHGLPKEIYVIFLSRVVTNMGSFVFPMLALIMTQKIGIEKYKAGLYITIVVLLSAPGMLMGGKLVDTIGAKKVLIIFQGLAGITFLVCGFIKPSMTLAIVMMLAQIIASISMPANDAMIADFTTQKNRKQAFSLLYMGNNLGLALGPVIAGLLYKNYLNLVFIGDGITTLISLALVSIFIKQTVHISEKHLLTKDNIHEKKEEGSVFYVLRKRPMLLCFACIMFIYQFAYSQYGFTLPLQLGELFKESGAKLFGLLACVNALVVILVTPFIAKVTERIEHILIIALGGLLYSIAFGSFGFIYNFHLFFIAIVIMTLGEISISINLGTYVANHTPISHRGRINGIIPMIYGAGFAIGPMTMGKYISVFGIRSGWIFIGILMFFASTCMIMLYRIENRIN